MGGHAYRDDVPGASVTDDLVATMLTPGTPEALAWAAVVEALGEPWVEPDDIEHLPAEHREAAGRIAARMVEVARIMREHLPPGLVAALHYIGEGFRVFPVDPQTKRPARILPLPGEGPGPDGKAGAYCATDDEEQVRAWWTEEPDARVGIALGGLAVVEVEGRGKGGNPVAVATLIAEVAEPLPRTLTARSPSGGLHLYFRADDAPGFLPLGDRCAEARGYGLDNLRHGPGMYVVAPSALVAADEDGREWVRHDPIADLPAWVSRRPARPPGREVVLPDGESWTARARAYLRAPFDDAANADEGQRHPALTSLARACGALMASGDLAPAQADRLMADAATASGLPEHEAEGVRRWMHAESFQPLPDRDATKTRRTK